MPGMEHLSFKSGRKLYLGVTGLQAANHHAPNTDGRERYVHFAFSHTAIDGHPGSQVFPQAWGVLI